MYKKDMRKAEIISQDTIVWSCLSATCNGWKREEFTFEKHPLCPFCSSEMKKETRSLPQINYEFAFHKNKKHS